MKSVLAVCYEGADRCPGSGTRLVTKDTIVTLLGIQIFLISLSPGAFAGAQNPPPMACLFYIHTDQVVEWSWI